jgi:adenosylcobinamide-phosphate synthase
MPALITLLAFLADWLIGDPQSWPHPVRWIGKAIDFCEAVIRRALKSLGREGPAAFVLCGLIMYIILAGLSGLSVWAILWLAHKAGLAVWAIVAVYLVFSSICLRDLLNHTARVEERLRAGDLEGARQRLSWIVGRDVAPLDKQAVRRAEIETLSENFSDGLVAPLFYLALGGPVFAWVYKCTNTLDSMVGYKNDKYLYLGRVSARADDVLNFIPSRLAGLILTLAARVLKRDHKESLRVWRAEGDYHASPNSGQTEAAMAGALGVYLGGTYIYQGVTHPKPRLHEKGRPADAGDVKACEDMVRVGTVITLAFAIAVELAIVFLGGGGSFFWGIF